MYLTVKVNVKDKTKALVQNTEAQTLAQIETTAQTKAMAMAITRAELEPKSSRWLKLWSWSWSWSWSCMVVGAHETQSLSSTMSAFQRIPKWWLWKAIIFRDRSRVSKVPAGVRQGSVECSVLHSHLCAQQYTGSETSSSLTASL